MKNLFLLIFIILAQYGFGQRHFFVSNKVIIQCDSSIIHFDRHDSLTIRINLFWNVGNKSININKHCYYPFVFSTHSPNDTIGYIRYTDHKILIIPKITTNNSKAQLLFSFSNRIKTWKLHDIHGFEDRMRLIGAYYSPKYKEKIYLFRFDTFPTKTVLGELYVGLRIGIVKAVFYTHYQPLNLNCIIDER